jgi:hypothetical protein
MVRRFFILAYNSEAPPGPRIVDYDSPDPTSFDYLDLKSCKRWEGPLPEDFRLYIGDGGRSEFLTNPMGLPIMSDQLLLELWDLIGRDVQLLEAPLYDVQTRRPVGGYKIVNILRCLSVIDLRYSRWSLLELSKGYPPFIDVSREVLRRDLVPADVHFFRPLAIRTPELESEDIWDSNIYTEIVSEEFVARVQGWVKELSFIEVETVEG